MPTEEAKIKFTEMFAGELQALAEHKSPSIISDIAKQFVDSLIQLKEKLKRDPGTHTVSPQGEIVWSENRNQIISDFALKLSKIFEPVGGLNPSEASAFWSGNGVHRAREHGTSILQTIPGFVIDKVDCALKEVFTPNAYQRKDGALDTAAHLALWAALSRLYAKGTNNDAHVFLVEGATSNQSVFWNTELQTLRERQKEGEVNKIFLHTLHQELVSFYHEFLDCKQQVQKVESISPEVSERKKGLMKATERDLQTFLKDEDNWTTVELLDADNFSLITSGRAEEVKTVKIATLKRMASRFEHTLKQTTEFHQAQTDPEKYIENKFNARINKIKLKLQGEGNVEHHLADLLVIKAELKKDIERAKIHESKELMALLSNCADTVDNMISDLAVVIRGQIADFLENKFITPIVSIMAGVENGTRNPQHALVELNLIKHLFLRESKPVLDKGAHLFDLFFKHAKDQILEKLPESEKSEVSSKEDAVPRSKTSPLG